VGWLVTGAGLALAALALPTFAGGRRPAPSGVPHPAVSIRVAASTDTVEGR
jgi:hypothetical protein